MTTQEDYTALARKGQEMTMVRSRIIGEMRIHAAELPAGSCARSAVDFALLNRTSEVKRAVLPRGMTTARSPIERCRASFLTAGQVLARERGRDHFRKACISALSSATCHRSPFSIFVVSVHGWNNCTNPPWTRKA